MTVHESRVLVRRAQFDDLEMLVPLFDGYRQFYRQQSDLSGARQFLEARLTGGESVIFLALHGDGASGFTQLYPSFSSVSLRRLWILNDLFVAGDRRGNGIATALLERARQWAVETDSKGLVLETALENPARALYERLGWRHDDGFVHYALTL